MQGDTDLADLRHQMSLKVQEMILQNKESEGSFHASPVSRMSLSIDEDENTDIKNLLVQIGTL